jgi:hypothetical protein
LGALGLVVNIIILWNTLYINAALDQLVGEGYSIQPKDVARLSPLVFEHINLLGRYAFTVPDLGGEGPASAPPQSGRRLGGRRLRSVGHGICKTRVTVTRFSVPLIPTTQPRYSVRWVFGRLSLVPGYPLPGKFAHFQPHKVCASPPSSPGAGTPRSPRPAASFPQSRKRVVAPLRKGADLRQSIAFPAMSPHRYLSHQDVGPIRGKPRRARCTDLHTLGWYNYHNNAVCLPGSRHAVAVVALVCTQWRCTLRDSTATPG